MTNLTPLDGYESITNALDRYMARSEFFAAIEQRDRPEALRILREVGADEEMVYRMVSTLISTESNPPSTTSD
jgi:hypothetical protein